MRKMCMPDVTRLALAQSKALRLAERQRLKQRVREAAARDPDVSSTELGARFGVSGETVHRWLKEGK